MIQPGSYNLIIPLIYLLHLPLDTKIFVWNTLFYIDKSLQWLHIKCYLFFQFLFYFGHLSNTHWHLCWNPKWQKVKVLSCFCEYNRLICQQQQYNILIMKYHNKCVWPFNLWTMILVMTYLCIYTERSRWIILD